MMSNRKEGTDALNTEDKEKNKTSKSRRRKDKRKLDPDTILSKALTKVLRHEAVNLGIAISSDGYVSVEDLLTFQDGGNKNGRQKGKKGGRGGGRFSQYSVEDIKRIATNSDKQRFRLAMRKHPSISNENNEEKCEEVLCIRANQGHTMTCINEEELLTPITKDELMNMKPNSIVHGTYRKAWIEYIQKEGLCRMKRNHIHFAPGLPLGFIIGKEEASNDEKGVKVISGMRTSCDVLIYLDEQKCAKDNLRFFRSDNGVILTSGLGERGMLPVCYFSKVVDVKSNMIILNQSEDMIA